MKVTLGSCQLTWHFCSLLSRNSFKLFSCIVSIYVSCNYGSHNWPTVARNARILINWFWLMERWNNRFISFRNTGQNVTVNGDCYHAVKTDYLMRKIEDRGLHYILYQQFGATCRTNVITWLHREKDSVNTSFHVNIISVITQIPVKMLIVSHLKLELQNGVPISATFHLSHNYGSKIENTLFLKNNP